MDLVGMHASYKGDQVALVEGDRSLTWSEYDALKNRLANALVTLGIDRSDKVICYMHNCIERFVLTNAGDTLGITIVPMSYRLTAPEVAYIVNDSEARYVVFGEEFGDVIEKVRPESPKVQAWISTGASTGDGVLAMAELTDAASTDAPEALAEGGGVMMYTSGTTGNPKGAYREPGQTSPEQRAQWFADMLAGFDIRGGDDVHLVCGPLYHGAPFTFSMVATGIGSKIVIMPRFDAETAAKLIEEHKVGFTVMAPVLVKRFLALGAETLGRYDLSSLHTVVTTGAPCPTATKEEWYELVGPSLYEFYGSTELSFNTIMTPEHMLAKPGSCGQAFPGVELVVLDDDGNDCPVGEPGELFVRKHPLSFSGYYKREEATKGAYKGEDLISVGDVAYVDEDGFFYICDRKTDMIISGGVNVYPQEIEEAVMELPDVLDCGAVGVEDARFGERPVVFVVARSAAVRPGLEERIAAHCATRLGRIKQPDRVRVVDELPRSATGKLLRRELRRQAATDGTAH